MKCNIQEITNEVIRRNINLFENYEDWTKGAMSLSTIPEGKDIFHAISRLSTKYKWKENELKFSNAQRTNRTVTIATFLLMCKDNGIDIARYRIDDEANNLHQSCKSHLKTKPIGPQTMPKCQHSYIPWDYVKKSASYNSQLVEFLCGVVDVDTIRRLGDDYALGATKDGGVIYWQIDSNGNVRTGKIMHYNTETGHRIKDRQDTTNWVHSIMRKNRLISDFNLSQCLFGEHLLKIHPNKIVSVVESEKTALLGAAVYPEYVWLATGGKYALNPDKMKVLAGRKVIMFPDTDTTGDTYKYWVRKSKELTFCDCTVSDILEVNATPTQRSQKIDIGDWLIKNLSGCKDTISTVMTEKEEILNDMIAANHAIGLLVEELSLEIVA